MYVTDVPVMDRITDRGPAEVLAANYALFCALELLQGHADEIDQSEESALQQALTEAWNASNHMDEALDLFGIATL